MPSQLLTKLRPFLDQGSGNQADQATSTHPIDKVMRAKNTPVQDVLVNPPNPGNHPNQPMLNFTPHWAGGKWGQLMAKNTVAATGINNVSGVNTISIHETSGYPGHVGVDNMVARHLCIAPNNEWLPNATPPHWVTHELGNKGIGPQYYVDGNGTVFALVGEFDLGDEPRITSHSGAVNFTSIGIENGSVGDAEIRPANNNPTAGPYWFRMSTPANPDVGDAPGLVCFALVLPKGAPPDLNLIWFSTALAGAPIPNYPGSGDTNNIATRWGGWRNMIFTERDYRSLALLVRLLFEKYGVPRNFCILPYLKQDADAGNLDNLRMIVLADERQDMMARKFGMTVADIQNRTHAWTSSSGTKLWPKFFGFIPGIPAKPATPTTPFVPAVPALPELPTYRGVIAHAFVGGHPCPGPLFDWHRFSREVWDWWWYPFDLSLTPTPPLQPPPTGVITPPPRRGYLNARGNTPLREYYYDAAEPGADFTTLGARFNARAGTALDSVSSNNHFLLEPGTPVYAMANGVIVAARLQNPADAANPPFVLIRHEVFHQADAGTHTIDYDNPPTIVWTLTTYLDCHLFDYTQPSTNNPDWLNRMLIRLKECELAVAYKAAHNSNSTNDQRFQQAWNFSPTSTGPRPTSGTSIEADAGEYRRIINSLQAGNSVLFPLEAALNTTPVRAILGDFLGLCGTLSFNATGSQMQIFSLEQLTITGSTHVPLTWITQQWWIDASATVRLDGAATKSLPAGGLVYSYPLTGFLDWLNQITWSSEWRKHEVVDATGNPVAAPARPKTRIGL